MFDPYKECSFSESHYYDEFFDVVAGRRLGSGVSRIVFSCALDKTIVFKLQKDKHAYNNVYEWDMWQQYKNVPDVAKWLAPCISISPCGTILVQERTEPLQNAPKKLPAFLCDTKIANYGTLGKGKKKRVVCHDYEFLLTTKVKTGMKNVKWWNTETIYNRNVDKK